MPTLVKLQSIAGFQPGVTPDVLFVLHLWLLYTRLSLLRSTAGTMILSLCWKGLRSQQENPKAADLQRDKSSASLSRIPFIQAQSTSCHQLQSPSPHTSSGKLVSTSGGGKHHPTHPFGRKASQGKLSPLTQIVQTRWWLVPSPYHLVNSATQAICAKADNSNSGPTALYELWIYILQWNHQPLTNTKIPSVVSSWNWLMHQPNQRTGERCYCLGETCSTTQMHCRRDTYPSIYSLHSQASFLLPLRWCLQLNEHITAEFLFLICPLGVLLTLLRAIFKRAISWLGSFAVPSPLAACASLARNPISYYHPLNQRN